MRQRLVSAWLAECVAPGGRAVAVDLDLSLVDAELPNLELRKADILAGPVRPRSFDLVTARAVLHHVARPEAAVANLVASGRPGGAILLIEPDFLPVSVAEPASIRAFWDGWLAWSRRAGIDYPRCTTVGRRGPCTGRRRLELRGRLVASGDLDERSIDAFLEHCADPAWWTQTIAFTAVSARAPSD